MARSEHPSIEELRALLAVAETGTETAAAKRLGVTQPVVHRRLRPFRETPALVYTEANEVVLTDTGREAVPAIRRLVRQYDHLRRYLRGRRERPNLLRLGVGSSVTQYYLARALATLRQRRPEWEVQTRVLRGKDRIAEIVSGELDLVVLSHNQPQIENNARWVCGTRVGLAISELVRLTMCVIARQETPEAEQLGTVLAGQTVPLTMLQPWRLAGLDSESGIRQQIEGLLSDPSQRLAFGFEAGGWLGVKEFVRQGICPGLMPLALLVPEDQQTFVIRRLPAALAVTHRLLHRQDAGVEILEEVKTALQDAAQELQETVEGRWEGLL